MIHLDLSPFRRNVPDDDLLADLRQVAEERGASSVTMERYAAFGRYGSETVRRRFGSWNEALQRAGLQPSKQWRIPDEKLFANLESVWRHLGRQPRRSDLVAGATEVSSSVYERRFGTWRKALEVFVEWANKEERNRPLQQGPVDPGRRAPRQPSLRLRFRVMRRDGFRCCHCGRSPASTPGVELNVDHIKPWSEGGETELGNLQTLCDACNQGKGSLPDG